MSDQEWTKEALFDTPQSRRLVEEPIKIEQPAASEAARVPAPPVPAELQAVQQDPQLAEAVWRDVDGETDRRPDDGPTLAQLGMALYLLQALHGQPPPGKGHMARDDRDPREDKERGT